MAQKALAALLAALWVICVGCGSTVESPAAQPGSVVEVSVEEAAAIRSDDEPFVILDVRDNLRFRQSHVVGAQNIDVNNPDSWNDRTAVLDPTRRTVIYCGEQSACDDAATKLLARDFTALFMIGPYEPDTDRETWKNAGLPIDR